MHATLHKAIRLGQQGIPVFFCSFSKRPTLPGGFHNAVAAEAAIRALYEKAPGPLIGVPTGHQLSSSSRPAAPRCTAVVEGE